MKRWKGFVGNRLEQGRQDEWTDGDESFCCRSGGKM